MLAAQHEFGAGPTVFDPYDILKIAREADGEAIKAAFRRQAKETHPDSGGDPDAFGRVAAAYELLCDPVRRKAFDDTGYDPKLADPAELRGLIMLEKLVNDMVLDEREPGTFDPVAGLRGQLGAEIRQARLYIREMERHRVRIHRHLNRLGRRPGNDILGGMLRARIDTISTAIREAEEKIAGAERAQGMLDGYAYAVAGDTDEPAAEALRLQETLSSPT